MTKKISADVYFGLAAVLCALAFGLITPRLPASWTLRDPVYGYGSDSNTYWDASSHILTDHAFTQSAGLGFDFLAKLSYPTLMHQRTPGYPLYLAFERLLLGLRLPFTVSLLSLALVFFNTLAFLRLARYFSGSEKIFWAASPLLFLSPWVLLYSNGINSDFLTGSLALYGCYFFFSKARWGKWLAALFMAFAVFTRLNVIFFFFPLFILASIFSPKLRKAAAVCAVACVLVLFAWSLRNFILFKQFSPSSFTGLQLQQNYLRFANKNDPVYRWNSDAFRQNYFLQLAAKSNIYSAAFATDRQLTHDIIHFALSHPAIAAKAYAVSLVQLSINEYYILQFTRLHPALIWKILAAVVILIFYLAPLLLLFWDASRAALKKAADPYSLLLYSVAVFVLLSAAVWGGFTRYLLPVGYVIIMNALMRLQAYFQPQINPNND